MDIHMTDNNQTTDWTNEQSDLTRRGISQKVPFCAYCYEDVLENRNRHWYWSEGKFALLCKSCNRMLWRDYHKLEDPLNYHRHNAEFPDYVLEEVQRKAMTYRQ